MSPDWRFLVVSFRAIAPLLRRLLTLAAVLVAASSLVSVTVPAAGASIPAQDDEVVGPFPSWSNVKTDYRAVGDGAADDTAAIQRGLDALGKPGQSPVLFFPTGTYRITQPVLLTSRINISIVGEDPGTTTLVWDGPPGGTMLWVNGVAYSRFTRLTFDGKSRASVAVEQSWDHKQSHFDTGNEYSDDWFVDVEYGIHGGLDRKSVV